MVQDLSLFSFDANKLMALIQTSGDQDADGYPTAYGNQRDGITNAVNNLLEKDLTATADILDCRIGIIKKVMNGGASMMQRKKAIIVSEVRGWMGRVHSLSGDLLLQSVNFVE